MANRKGQSKNENIWIHAFEVTQPTRHKKDFTVYKVISNVFPKAFPEGVTTIVVWKRFNDFKKLYKELLQIHRQLHLRGEFPNFPKGQLFGRFQNDIIDERQQASLALLQFAALYPQLYTSKVFSKFFETSYDIEDLDLPVSTTAGQGSEGYREFREKACLEPERLWVPNNPATTISNNGDNLSITSSFESLILEGAATSGNLPQQTVLSEQEVYNREIPGHAISLSNNTCAQPTPIISCSGVTGSEKPSISVSQSLLEPKCSPHELDTRPESGISSSTSCSSLEAQMSSAEKENTSNSKNQQNSPSSGFFDFLPIFTKKDKRLSEETFLTSSLSSSYICEAAGHFAVAQEYESRADFRHAFSCYKQGIRILLEGVKSDDKNLVRTKLEKYISRAESLHTSYLSRHASDVAPDISFSVPLSSPTKKKEVSSFSVSPSKSGMVMKASSPEELRQYKVIRVIQRKVYAVVNSKDLNKTKCFIIKVVPKSPDISECKTSPILSHKIPFVVTLLKWFESEYSYILLLGYASGGRLRDFVNDYQTKQIVIPKFDEESSQYIMEDDSAKRQTEKSKALALITALNELGNKILQQQEQDKDAENHNPINQQPTLSDQESSDTAATLENDLSDPSSWKDIDTKDLIENSKFLLAAVSRTLAGSEKCDTFNVEKGDGTSEGSAIAKMQSPPPSPECKSVSSMDNPKDKSNGCKGTPKRRNPLTLLIDLNENMSCETDYGRPRHRNASGSITFLDSPKLKTSKSSTDLKDSAMGSPSHALGTDVLYIKRIVPECCIKVWAAEIIMGLEEIHEMGFTYGELDIKNILLGENGHIVISFKSQWFQADENYVPKTNEYSSPEVRNSFGQALSRIHPSADFWSLGAILFELFIGQSVHSVHPEGFHAQTVIRVPEANLIGDEVSSDVRTFLSELLQFDPSHRLGYYGAAELKAHPLFEDFDWDGALEAATILLSHSETK